MKNQGAKILREAFAKKKKENKKISMQVIANKAAMSRSLLSQIFSGKRNLSADKLDDLCRLLDLDKEKRDFLARSILSRRNLKLDSTLVGVGPAVGSPEKISSETWAYQPKKNFVVLQDWFYLAILDITLIDDYDGTMEFIARRMGLEKSTVENALRVLQEADLLEEKKGRWIKKSKLIDFHSGADKKLIRTYHKATLKKAIEVLNEKTQDDDVQKRLITGMSVTIAEEKIAWVQQKISQLLKEVVEDSANSAADEVYQFSVQFFPLTSKP